MIILKKYIIIIFISDMFFDPRTECVFCPFSFTKLNAKIACMSNLSTDNERSEATVMDAAILNRVELTPALIEKFICALIEMGYGLKDIDTCRANLFELYCYLPDTKQITDKTRPEWKVWMENCGIPPATVDERITSLECLYWYLENGTSIEKNAFSDQCEKSEDSFPLLSIRVENIQKASKRKVWKTKRIFDIIFSFIMLVLLLPLFLLTAVFIFLDDPHGSPFFSQIRIGLNEKPFNFYKFRTMTVDAQERLEELRDQNEMDGPVFKIRDDPRITRIGKGLRRTSIDELPQLLNVLKGDMSIVGPRPPLPNEVEAFTEYQKLKLTVKPGLTCTWQIQPNRNDFSFSKWIDMDLDYILNCTPWLDFKLILKTPIVMLRREGR